MTFVLTQRGRARLISCSAKSFGFAVVLGITCITRLFAASSEIAIPGDRAFPESLSSTQDGTLFIGSLAEGGIFRAAPGAAQAEPWIKPGANDSRSMLGVLTDESSGTLWACSNDMSSMGVAGPSAAKGSALKSFDLKTGASKGSVPLPGERAFCNDIAIGPDGAAYVTDSSSPHILRLKPGSSHFEFWATDPRFEVKGGAGLDGIAFGSDGDLYVNTFNGNGLFKVEVKEGNAGRITQLETSRPIELPDGMRKYGDHTLLMIEGAGRLDRVTVNGNKATVETLKDGYVGPVSVTQVGNTAWVLEGQLPYLFDPKMKGQNPRLPFRAIPQPKLVVSACRSAARKAQVSCLLSRRAPFPCMMAASPAHQAERTCRQQQQAGRLRHLIGRMDLIDKKIARVGVLRPVALRIVGLAHIRPGVRTDQHFIDVHGKSENVGNSSTFLGHFNRPALEITKRIDHAVDRGRVRDAG
jgi:sugar lactone lactonase YvrE